MMTVYIDGQEVECESIQLREDNIIVGCHCAGGYHQEIKGFSNILIQNDVLVAEIADDSPEGTFTASCELNLDDLIQEMGKTVLKTKFKLENKEFIEEMNNIFD